MATIWRRRLSLLALGLLALVLAGCSLGPGELAMRQAIGTYIGAAENYPMAYVEARSFQFRDLQRVPDADPDQYRVHAGFDFLYTADGPQIVAALQEQARAEREKEKHRDGSVLGKLARAAADALASHGREQRFADVKAGDRDHYEGDFTLARNHDGSWQVVAADYR